MRYLVKDSQKYIFILPIQLIIFFLTWVMLYYTLRKKK